MIGVHRNRLDLCFGGGSIGWRWVVCQVGELSDAGLLREGQIEAYRRRKSSHSCGQCGRCQFVFTFSMASNKIRIKSKEEENSIWSQQR